MELFEDASDTDALTGEWGVFHSHPTDESLSVQTCVRRIPAAVDERLRYAAGMKRKSRLGVKGDVVQIDSDRDQNMKLNVLRAAWALTDTKNAEVRAKDAGAASFYAKELSAIVNPGDLVKLDGRWTQAIKERVLTEQDALRNHIVKRADKMNLEADEDDAGKEQTS